MQESWGLDGCAENFPLLRTDETFNRQENHGKDLVTTEYGATILQINIPLLRTEETFNRQENYGKDLKEARED